MRVWAVLLVLMGVCGACDREAAPEAAPPAPVDVVDTAESPEVIAAREAEAKRVAAREKLAAETGGDLLGGMARGLYGLQPQPLLRFVHMTDVEIGYPEAEDRYDAVLRVLEGMRPVPDFVVMTGDLTHSFRSSQVRVFRKGLERLEMPVYLVPGNHDLTFHPRSRDRWKYARKFKQQPGLPYRVDVGPLALIGLDSQLMNIRHRPSRYVPCCVWAESGACTEKRARDRVRRACRATWRGPTDQRVWVSEEDDGEDDDDRSRIVEVCPEEPGERDVCVRTPDPFNAALAAFQWGALGELMKDARVEGQRVLLFHHIPPVSKIALREVKHQWHAQDKARLRKLQRYYPVEAHLVGHFHQDEVRFFDGVPVLVAPPVSPKYGRHSSLRVYSVWEDGLSYEQVYVGVGSETLSYRRDLRGLRGEAEVERVKALHDAAGESALETWYWRRYAAQEGFRDLWPKARRQLYPKTLAWEVEGEPAVE